MKWISVKDKLPELPDEDYCDVMVIAAYKTIIGNKADMRVSAMLYERVLKYGKRVERWKYHWDRICYDEITHWMPLPESPKECEA